MGGLGNGRRGGRAPPLMVASLITCILVLGFNYWVSSSRNLELQTKLYELEGQVRRGAAERGVAEMKKNEFQEQIQKQVQEINHMESLRRKQLEDAHNTYSQEKAKLQQNISSGTKTIEELKGQLNQMNNELGKLQKELQRCQANPSILNNKLTADIAHCQSQVLSQKKLCDEKMAAIKLEVQKNVQKVVPPAGAPTQVNTEAGEQKEEPIVKAAPTEAEATTAVSKKPNIPQGKGSKTSELLNNYINTDKELSEQPLIDDLSKADSQTVPLATSENQNELQQKEGEGKTSEATTRKGLTNHLMDDKDIEVMDVHEEGAQTEEADPGVQDILNGQEKAVVPQRPEEPEEYDADEQVVDGVDLEKQRNKNTEEEMADYNGDDENEGEYEADKQAALSQN